MAKVLHGMNFSYDYSELLFDLWEDMEEGFISNDSIIYIVRGDAINLTESDVYRPIIDYYTDEDLHDLYDPLEMMEEMLEEKMKLGFLYEDEEWADFVST